MGAIKGKCDILGNGKVEEKERKERGNIERIDCSLCLCWSVGQSGLVNGQSGQVSPTES